MENDIRPIVDTFVKVEKRSGYLFNSLAVFIQAAGFHKWIVIKRKPSILRAIVGNEVFFLFDEIQGEVIVGHDPQGIGVGVGGEHVTKVNRAAFASTDLNGLVPSGVPTGQSGVDTWYYFFIPFYCYQVVA